MLQLAGAKSILLPPLLGTVVTTSSLFLVCFRVVIMVPATARAAPSGSPSRSWCPSRVLAFARLCAAQVLSEGRPFGSFYFVLSVLLQGICSRLLCCHTRFRRRSASLSYPFQETQLKEREAGIGSPNDIQRKCAIACASDEIDWLPLPSIGSCFPMERWESANCVSQSARSLEWEQSRKEAA